MDSGLWNDVRPNGDCSQSVGVMVTRAGSKESFRPDGMTAVVTGGASAIGAAVAAKLIDNGAHVFVTDLPAVIRTQEDEPSRRCR